MRKAHRLLALFSLLVLVTIVGLGAQPTATDARSGPPADLEALNQRLLPLFELNGVVYTDADETTDHLVVGVSNRGIETAVRARLAALGVPDTLVDVVDSPEIYNVDSLRTGVFRPVLAGVQINFPSYLCSLGFNANLGGVEGFVTASHCTTTQGGVEGTLYYQPLESSQPLSIGIETVDPDYTSGAGCPSGYECRRSDSAFVRYTNATGTLGAIARTSGPNNGSLDAVGTFTIVGEGTATVNTTVNKVGRTTGWTQARVSSTCANVGVSGTSIVQLCQNIVSSRNKVIVQGGDSGSGVFTINSGNDVTLQGILWGGSTNGRTMVYSPIGNIEEELGALTTSGSSGPITLESISVTPANYSIGVGGTQQFTATGHYSDQSASDITDQVSWSTGNDSVATITPEGVATGVATGTTTVTAALAAITGNTSLTVTDSPPPPSGSTVSVLSPIDYATTGGKNNDRHLTITLALQDDLGTPVAGASVSIVLLRDSLEVASGTGQTGSDGTVTFTLHNASSGMYNTDVAVVTAAGLVWDHVPPDDPGFLK